MDVDKYASDHLASKLEDKTELDGELMEKNKHIGPMWLCLGSEPYLEAEEKFSGRAFHREIIWKGVVK